MKKLFTFLCVSFLISCSPKSVPLKGKYSDVPFTIKSDKPFDAVWSNVIDLFSSRGYSIKVIDKSSGLIVSEKVSLPFTVENISGKLLDKDAYVVLEILNVGGLTYRPRSATGEFNVRIKTVDGKTSIGVNITNIVGIVPAGSGGMTLTVGGKSTGIFEGMITESVK